MKLTKHKCKDGGYYYYISLSFRNEKGISTTRTFKKLGSTKELVAKLGPNVDIDQWAKEQVKIATLQYKENNATTTEYFSLKQREYSHDTPRSSLCMGNIYINQILYALGINKLCKDILFGTKAKMNLEQILCDLVSSRLIAPASKKSTFEYAQAHYFEKPSYEQHDVYRALDLIQNNSELIQSSLYKSSEGVIKRDKSVIYYDCTNFFFESLTESELRKYGKSKENRPNPIVQVGMFIDSNGLPLGMGIYPGNTNEQTTLAPIEQRIINDYDLNTTHLIVCTDAGLCSTQNRILNNTKHRDFITIHSLKKTKKDIAKWALDYGRSLKIDPIRADENPNIIKRELMNNNWKLVGDASGKLYSLYDIDENDPEYYNKVFYKERYIIENGFEQRLIVTFCLKYKKKMEKQRELLVQSANNKIKRNTLDLNGEPIDVKHEYLIDDEALYADCKYDGFYAMCTSLDKDERTVEQIIAINKGRWEIEEYFKIMKSDIKTRPIHHSLDERIKAHFLVCFISLLVFRILEYKVNQHSNRLITAPELIKTLKEISIAKIDGVRYMGIYNRNHITDAIEQAAGYTFAYEVITDKKIASIIKNSKKI